MLYPPIYIYIHVYTILYHIRLYVVLSIWDVWRVVLYIWDEPPPWSTSCNAWSGLEGAQGPGEVQAILFPGKAMNKGRTMENHWDNYGQPSGNWGKPWTEGNTMENDGIATKSQMFRQKMTEAIDGKGVLGVGCAPVLLMRRSRWPFCKRQLICWKQGWLVETATSRQEECERIQPRREHIVLETLGSLLHSSY